MRRFLGVLAAVLLWAGAASAQSCNPPSGFIVQNGAISIGDLILYGPACGQIQGLSGAPVNLTLSTLTINPPANTLTQALQINQTIAGQFPAPSTGAFNTISLNDSADCSIDSALQCEGFYVQHVIGGASVKSSRVTIYTHTFVNADSAVSGPNRDFVGIGSLVETTAHFPVTGVPATLFAGSGGVTANPGTTGLNALVGYELDAVNNSTSVPFVIGWNVSYNGFQQATTLSAGYEVSALAGTPGWQVAYALNTQSGAFPITSTGTVLAGVDIAGLGLIPAATGIDLRAFNFSTNAFVTTGWRVDGAGEMHSSQSVDLNGAINIGYGVTDGNATGVFATSALFTHSIALGTSNNVPLAFVVGSPNLVAGSINTSAQWTFGIAGTTTGQTTYSGSTSGGAIVKAQNTAGTPTLTLPNTSGTFATSVTSETNVTLSLSATTGLVTPGWTGTLSVARGGTACGAASGTCLDNIAGFSSTGFINRTGAGTYTFVGATGSGNVVLATSPTILTSETLSNNGITVSTDGLLLQNSTAASAGTQQLSPRVHWFGSGWQTTTPQSENVEWEAEVIPLQQATHPAAFLNFASRINGGSFINKFQVVNDIVSGQTSVNFLGTSSVQFSLNGVGVFYADASQVLMGAVTNVPVSILVNNAAVLIAQTAGTVKFNNAASFSANGAVATVLGSIGPTGSHTTVQTWFTIVDSGGTTRYIPAF